MSKSESFGKFYGNSFVGCPQCGLIGCDCIPANDPDPVEEAFDNLCKRCQSEPCECNPQVLASPRGISKAGAEVCSVCRRAKNMCICTSHAPVKLIHEQGMNANPTRVERPFANAYIEVLVNEGMLHYYNRDAEGLTRFLRRVLP